MLRVPSALLHLRAGRLADAVLTGSLATLVLAAALGGVKFDVIGGLGTLCVLLTLLLLAAFDLVVRWEAMDIQSPGRRGAGIQRWFRVLLRHAWPEVVLVLGIVTGHLLWTG